MSILVFIDQTNGEIRKASLEAACYGADLAAKMNTVADAMILGEVSEDIALLGKYGIRKVFHSDHSSFNNMDAQVYARAIEQIMQLSNASIIIFSNNTTGKAVAPRVSVRLQAGLVAGAIDLPDTSNGFVVKKNVFSGKAFAHVYIQTAVKIISLTPNSYAINQKEGSAAVEKIVLNPHAGKIHVTATNKVTGEVPLTEAEIVVSGGRGLKGPENWGLVTDLAKLLGAATACSRPVADIHWRPHHEHVGQTGIAIAPNLYIAIGISGAIQHLAGVNRSKTIVVINKDPEAPFFKAADYGIVGDAFEVLPKMIEAVKKLKNIS